MDTPNFAAYEKTELEEAIENFEKRFELIELMIQKMAIHSRFLNERDFFAGSGLFDNHSAKRTFLQAFESEKGKTEILFCELMEKKIKRIEKKESEEAEKALKIKERKIKERKERKKKKK